MTFHPTHGEGGRLVYTIEDIRDIKAMIALTGTGRGGRQGFTDEVLCPERCTRSEGGEPFYHPLRDRDHLIPGDQVLVDVSAYNVEVEPMQWCDVIGLAAGDAAVFPYKVTIPDRGQGQYAAGEIHAWRRPVSLHQALLEYAATSERMAKT